MTLNEWSLNVVTSNTSFGFVDRDILVYTNHGTGSTCSVSFFGGMIGKGLLLPGVDYCATPPAPFPAQTLNFCFRGGTGNLMTADAIFTDSHGFQCGVIQTDLAEFNGYGFDNASPNMPYAPMNFGLFCATNTEHPGQTPTTGIGYAFCLDSIGFGNFYRLYKFNTGFSTGKDAGVTSTYTTLYSSESAQWALNTWYTLTLFWFTDPFFLKGTWLIGWPLNIFDGTVAGYLPDLSDFNPYTIGPLKYRPLFNIVHTGEGSVALASSLSEGLYVAAITNQSVVLFRNTKIWRMTPPTINGVSYPPP